MGVTFSRRESHKSARKKRQGRKPTDLYCDSTESIDSQTFPKMTCEDLNKELERKNQELERKNQEIARQSEMLEELQLRVREYQVRMESIEQIRAKIAELEQENQKLRARMRTVKTDSPYLAKPSVTVSHASTSTDQQGAEEKRVRTKEADTNTDTEASLDTSDGSNIITTRKAKNAQVGNNNIMNIVGFFTSGRYGNDQNSDENVNVRIKELEKRIRELQRELQIEKDKVEILRRQNEVLEGRETKLLENSLPFRTAASSGISDICDTSKWIFIQFYRLQIYTEQFISLGWCQLFWIGRSGKDIGSNQIDMYDFSNDA
ncbi:hypothetical protein ACJMK2_040975 [Sinanodonta woodiana]|uniref:Uncharacterized protein n=1 Tax=Sinanodonta woodiana TaxID=1069815 RepID=A0ABD3W2Q5_SINWO